MGEMLGRLPGALMRACLLALLSLLFVPPLHAGNVPEAAGGGYQGAEYWRDVRQGVAGQSQIKGVERGVLIDSSGEEWRQLRNETLKPYGAWLLAIAVVGLLGLHAVLGAKQIDGGRSGRTIERWKAFDRHLHWLMAGLFIILAVTGLLVLYSRYFLIDVTGPAYGTIMQFSKLSHNYLGPLFVVTFVVMLLRWLRHNLFNAVDLAWFAKGGGLFTDAHPHAGFMNGGEKVWYWVLALIGIVICVTGVILDFPNFGQERTLMQDVSLIHAGASLILICGALAHMYMGSIGTEGALESMTTGQVDENWAKQHHDLWYEEVTGKSAGHAEEAARDEAQGAAPGAAR